MRVSSSHFQCCPKRIQESLAVVLATRLATESTWTARREDQSRPLSWHGSSTVSTRPSSMSSAIACWKPAEKDSSRQSSGSDSEWSKSTFATVTWSSRWVRHDDRRLAVWIFNGDVFLHYSVLGSDRDSLLEEQRGERYRRWQAEGVHDGGEETGVGNVNVQHESGPGSR